MWEKEIMMELFNSKRSAVICRRDANQVATDVDAFVKCNSFQYYLLINTWAYMLRDCGCDEDIFFIAVERYGLLTTIDRMSKAGTAILASYPTFPSLELWITDLVKECDLHEAAQVLRFGKRFTLMQADILEKTSIQNFVDVNNINKMKDRVGYPPKLLQRMKFYIGKALEGIDISNLYSDGYFSPGAVCNTYKSEVDKVTSWTLPYFGSFEYPVNASGSRLYTPGDDWGRVYHHGRDHVPGIGGIQFPAYSKAIPVEKSYKAYRIIAENDSTRQFFEQALRKRMWDAMCRNGVSAEVNLKDQDNNAVALPIFGEDVATIDLTSASDRVPWSIVAEVFPEEVVTIMKKLRSWYLRVGKREYMAYMAFTSGSALCFITESLFFWSITQVAKEMYTTFVETNDLITYVYGDDIIVSTPIYDTTVEILTLLNAEVNLDKSYASGHFRESCGADWIVMGDSGNCRVEFMTSAYWPRKGIQARMDCVPSLLELNTRLFRYKHVHFFLKTQIAALCKDKMTFTQECNVSDVVTDCLDLYDDTYLPCRPPYTREAIKNGTLPPTINRGKARVAELVSRKSSVSLDDPSVQMYYYTQYLLHGPLFEDPLMELLKVSSPRRSTKSTVNGVSFDVRVDPVF